MFASVIEEFRALEEIEAIALGGSRSGEMFDENSDYDIYLYCTKPVPEEKRRLILEKYCARLELGNHFWELEDNGTFLDGIDFDILYRNLDDFCAGVSAVVEKCQPQNAYTTCMWHNLLTCKVLYDRGSRLTAAKQRFCVPYPEALRQNIMERGWKLLSSAMPAYRLQIEKALKRGDPVSVNHRVSAFLETYFDVIFAVNRKTHPGEKRLISLCVQQCGILPDRFEENLQSLFGHMFTDAKDLTEDLETILTNLKKIMA
jgi:predicted nucleotidyltransferase